MSRLFSKLIRCRRGSAIGRKVRGGRKSRRFAIYLANDRRGASAVEYGVLIAGIAVAIVVAVADLGSNLNDNYGDVVAAIEPAAGGGPSGSSWPSGTGSSGGGSSGGGSSGTGSSGGGSSGTGSSGGGSSGGGALPGDNNLPGGSGSTTDGRGSAGDGSGGGATADTGSSGGGGSASSGGSGGGSGGGTAGGASGGSGGSGNGEGTAGGGSSGSATASVSGDTTTLAFLSANDPRGQNGGRIGGGSALGASKEGDEELRSPDGDPGSSGLPTDDATDFGLLALLALLLLAAAYYIVRKLASSSPSHDTPEFRAKLSRRVHNFAKSAGS